MFLKKKRDPLRETLYAIYYVRNGISRIDVLLDRVKSRRERLLQIATELELRGESFLARKYASEVAKLDKIESRLLDIRLVLEKLSTSLEYAVNVKKIEEIATGVYQILVEMKKIPESSIPELSFTLTNLEYSIRNILDELKIESLDMSFDTHLDDNAKRILEEAKAILKQKLEAEISPETNVRSK